MIAWLLALAVAFVVVAGPVIWLVSPFLAQIADDHLRAVQRQQDRLRLTAAGRTVRRG